jgi:hypothetical protein
LKKKKKFVVCLVVKAALRINPEVVQKLTNIQHNLGRQTSARAIFLVFLLISASENPSIFRVHLGKGQRETHAHKQYFGIQYTNGYRIASIRGMKNVEETGKPGY